MVPYYCQTAPSRYRVAVACTACRKRWYVVWDDYPGPGCDYGTVSAAELERDAAQAKAVRWNCVSCGHRLKASLYQAGKKGKCPHCGQAQPIPERAVDASMK